MRSANALPAQPPEGEAKGTFAGGALSSSQPTSFTLSSAQLSSSQLTSFTSLPSFNMSLTSRARAWRVLVVSPGASRAGELLGTSGAVVAFALGVAAGAVTKRGKLCVERNARLV
jgi:hypothetical protein